MDASNLAWKMGLVAQKKAKLQALMSTYSYERRDHACRIIETSGEYLRFVCATDLQIANVRNLGTDSGADNNGVGPDVKADQSLTGGVANDAPKTKEEQQQEDLKFLRGFFGKNGQFLLGVDAPFGPSVLTPPQLSSEDGNKPRPFKINHGVRAPNPRVCFSTEETGYLYDQMTGAATFHLVIFASTLSATIRGRVSTFAASLLKADGFYQKFGGAERFNIILVVKHLPWETDAILSTPELRILQQHATVVYDDRAPDEDAHTTWGANHTEGGLAVVRPDLWVGTTVLPDEVDSLFQYFSGFLLPVAA